MPAWVTEGYREYARRLPHECALSLREIPLGQRPRSGSVQRAVGEEGKRMLAAMGAGQRIIALDVDPGNFLGVFTGEKGVVFYAEARPNEPSAKLHRYKLEDRKAEEVLGEGGPERLTVHLPGAGAKLIGGGLRIDYFFCLSHVSPFVVREFLVSFVRCYLCMAFLLMQSITSRNFSYPLI